MVNKISGARYRMRRTTLAGLIDSTRDCNSHTDDLVAGKFNERIEEVKFEDVSRQTRSNAGYDRRDVSDSVTIGGIGAVDVEESE